MSEKPESSDTPTESNLPISPENLESIVLTDPKGTRLPIHKMKKLGPLFIEVENIEERICEGSESIDTLVGSVTPLGFNPDHQEQSESEMEEELGESKVDPEKTPEKPKSPPESD